PICTRDALLVAAVEHGGALPEILAAASTLAGRSLTAAVLDPAARARLLRLDGGRLRFRDPLVRPAVLGLEPLARRLAANAAMAGALSGDPLRRAWHRAQSIIGPDDRLADELEDGHPASLRGGAVTTAVWALERAARLTTDPARRGRRLLLAAGHAFALGRAELVGRLVTEAARDELAEQDRARLEWLKEIFTDGTPGDADRVTELCATAARSVVAGDRDLALDLLHGAALRCWWAEPGSRSRREVAGVAESLPLPATDARYVAALALAEPVRRGAAVHELLSAALPAGALDAVALHLLGQAAYAIGDLPRAADVLSRAEPRLRDEGRLGLLAQALVTRSACQLLTGDLDRAGAAAAEGRRLAAD
ncbi:hypothetical protein ACWEPC_59400, partial [Nonomuraea sp. NPDC004297]